MATPLNCAYQLLNQALTTAPGMEDGLIDQAEYAAYLAHVAPNLEIARDAADFLATGLNSTQWPPAAQALVDQLVPQILDEAASLDLERNLPYADYVVFAPVTADETLFAQLRAELGLPAPDPTHDWCVDVAG